MKVCIAEKPSVAKEIASVLGAKNRKDGYFEGNGYQVTWAFGHLCTIKEPKLLNPVWDKWNLGYLPMIPKSYDVAVMNDKGVKSQFAVIKKLYKGADEIINCGDAGQEGELIQRWIMQLAGVRCPVKRLWISSLTEEAIRDGFKNLRPQREFDNLFKAGLARAEGDWLLGMNCTRLYTCKYGNHSVLSIGRVQTPTLSMIVTRDKEIENFKPEPYWILTTKYRNVVFTSEYGRIDSEEDANNKLDSVKDKIFVIDNIEQKKCQEQPPQLFDLTSLQVECNRRYGMSAEVTLNTLQSLYEKKLTTYPRVDTKYLTHDIYDKCPKILSRLKNRSMDVMPLLAAPLPKSKRVFDDSKVTDHHALMPTGQTPSSLNHAEQRVYGMIADRFIAVFYPPCTYSQTNVTGHAGTIHFKTSGKTIIDLGWRMVYSNDSPDDSEGKGDKEQRLPEFVKGESGKQIPSLEKKMTTPPKHYTDATLLQAMETCGRQVEDESLREAMKENGIGRPSSRASIIENLVKRGYVTRQKKNLLSTEKGRQLISIIKDRMLTSAETTGQWEKKLRLIERGQYTLESFMSELENQVKVIVDNVRNDKDTKPIAEPAMTRTVSDKTPNKRMMTKKRMDMTGAQLLGKTCPKCGIGIIRKGPYSYYCSEYKNGCKFKKPLK